MSTLLSPRVWALLLVVGLTIGVAASVRAQDAETPDEPAAEAPVEETVEETVEEEAPAEPAMGFNTDVASLSVALDTIWVMVAAFLVMWMQAGFCLVEAGLTRAKNAANICMKNLLDFCYGSLAYWVIGFGLMFSAGNEFMGDSGFFLQESTVEVTADDGTTTEESNFSPIGWTNVPLVFEVLLPARVCRHCRHDRLGCHGRADQVHLVHGLQPVHHGDHLSDLRPLDLGRRLAGQPGVLGLCRLNGRP